jgi:hypothetical protein
MDGGLDGRMREMRFSEDWRKNFGGTHSLIGRRLHGVEGKLYLPEDTILAYFFLAFFFYLCDGEGSRHDTKSLIVDGREGKLKLGAAFIFRKHLERCCIHSIDIESMISGLWSLILPVCCWKVVILVRDSWSLTSRDRKIILSCFT